MSRTPRLLLAVSTRALRAVSPLLPCNVVYRVADRFELRVALERMHFDMCVVGTHFDDSHCIEALRMVRRFAPEAALVCVRAVPFSRALGEATIGLLRTACDEIGADLFLDLVDAPDDAAAREALRELLRSALTSSRVPLQ